MLIMPYPDVNQLVSNARSRIQRILDQNLLGLYLWGSLATGDFDPGISNLDLVAATRSHVDNQEFERLRQMDLDLAQRYLA